MTENFDYWPFIVALSIAACVALIGGLSTEIGSWYRALKKPPYQPPDWLFGPAWTVIFLLIAFAAAEVWKAAALAEERWLIIIVFAVNAALNMLWSILFFKFKRPDWALVEVVLLWASIVVLIVVASNLSMRAALALVPYLLWVSFASVLNNAVVRLNRPF